MDWRKLIGVKAPKLSDLEATLAELRQQKAEAEAEVAQLTAGRRAVLRDGSDDDVARHDERAAAVARRLDRAEVAIDEVGAKLDAAKAEAAEATRRARYAAAGAKSVAIQAEVRRVYPEAVRVVRTLLRQLAEAEIAVAEANADRPAGADKLLGPEMFRLGRGATEKVLSTREVDLWAGRDGKPWPTEMQEHVIRSADGTGYVPAGKPGGPLRGARKLRFVETTFLSEESFRYVGRLAASLAMPGLMPGENAGWAPLKDHDFARPDGFARSVVDELARIDSPSPRPPRAPKVRHELVNLADLYADPQGNTDVYTGNVHPEMAGR